MKLAGLCWITTWYLSTNEIVSEIVTKPHAEVELHPSLERV